MQLVLTAAAAAHPPTPPAPPLPSVRQYHRDDAQVDPRWLPGDRDGDPEDSTCTCHIGNDDEEEEDDDDEDEENEPIACKKSSKRVSWACGTNDSV